MTTVAATPARRGSAWIAVGLLTAALAMVGFLALNVLLPGYERLKEHAGAPADLFGVAVSLAAYLSVVLAGSVLSVRRPENPIGWLLLVGGLCFSYADFSLAYVQRSIRLDSELPGYQLVDFLLIPVASLGSLLLFIWIPLLFPGGRLAGRAWRAVVWVAMATTLAYIVTGTATYEVAEYGPYLPNPLVLDRRLDAIVAFLAEVSTTLASLLFVLAFASVMVRFRRADGVERQQLKWFLAATAVVLLAIAVNALATSPWAWDLLLISIGLVPLAIGIAILRYRLYDIDRLISRTIGWAILTGILVAVFAGAVIGLQALLAGVTQGETLAVAASTLAAFALFQPLRRRIQVAVDRRFDRAQYDGQRTVDAFAERLRGEVELETVTNDLRTTAVGSVNPSRAGLWLRRSTS